jgi:hypothetical protein
MHKCGFACAAGAEQKKACFRRLKKSVYYFHISTQNGIPDSLLPYLIHRVKCINLDDLKDVQEKTDQDSGMEFRKKQVLRVANDVKKLILILVR